MFNNFFQTAECRRLEGEIRRLREVGTHRLGSPSSANRRRHHRLHAINTIEKTIQRLHHLPSDQVKPRIANDIQTRSWAPEIGPHSSTSWTSTGTRQRNHFAGADTRLTHSDSYSRYPRGLASSPNNNSFGDSRNSSQQQTFQSTSSAASEFWNSHGSGECFPPTKLPQSSTTLSNSSKGPPQNNLLTSSYSTTSSLGEGTNALPSPTNTSSSSFHLHADKGPSQLGAWYENLPVGAGNQPHRVQQQAYYASQRGVNNLIELNNANMVMSFAMENRLIMFLSAHHRENIIFLTLIKNLSCIYLSMTGCCFQFFLFFISFILLCNRPTLIQTTQQTKRLTSLPQ